MWSDGCTGVPDLDVRPCCVAHDYAYADQDDRAQADTSLLICLARHGRPWVGILYYLGVRLLGWWWYRRSGQARAEK